jgi:hypothetical protein
MSSNAIAIYGRVSSSEQRKGLTPMLNERTKDESLSLVLDLLVHMILTYIARQQRIAAPSGVRKAILAIVEREMEELLEHEQTTALLGSDQYRIIA